MTNIQECCDFYLTGLCLVFERPATCIPEQIIEKSVNHNSGFFLLVYGGYYTHVSVQRDHLQVIHNIGHMYYLLDQNKL